MKVKFQGNPMTLKGKEVKVGDKAPEFVVRDNGLNPVTLNDAKGKKVFVVVPSLDTSVCDLEVKRFNKEAAKYNDTTIYVISMDLPFAQARWCGLEDVENVVTLSDYKERSFGENYGCYIEELGLLTRAVFVLDENNKVTYVEYCEEVTSQPDFDEALKAINS